MTTAVSKTDVLIDYGQRYRLTTLVETGLYLGVGSGMTAGFPRYIAIDTDEDSVTIARSLGHDARHGNSGDLLGQVLEEITEPALIWLDAHALDCNRPFVGDLPSRDELPLYDELVAIAWWRHAPQSVVLIDDMPHVAQACAFMHRGIASVRAFVEIVDELPVRWERETRDGIMRLTPRRNT